MSGAIDTKISATLGSVLLILSACSHDSAPPSPAPAPVVKAAAQPKKGPTVEELTTGMVQATALGKSPLPLEVKFELGDKPTKGHPLDLNLALIPLEPANATTVIISGAEGFEALDARQFDFDHLDVGAVYRHTVKLTPNAEGVQLIGLKVTSSREDASETKEFSIPVIVGH